jgi:thiol:disulfide interchange protein
MKLALGLMLLLACAREQPRPAPTPPDLRGWHSHCGAGQKGDCFTDADHLLAEAKAAGRPVIIEIHAAWSMPSKRFRIDVLDNPRVAELVAQSFVGLRFDVSDGGEAAEALQKRFGAEALPMVILLRPDGSEAQRFGHVPTAGAFADAMMAARKP